MLLSDIAPGFGERMVIAGTTGTGKTVAVRSIVQYWFAELDASVQECVVIHDPKGTFKVPVQCVRVEGLARLSRMIKEGVVPPVIHYVPSIDECGDPVNAQKPLWAWVYSRAQRGRPTRIVIDEAYATCSESGRSSNELRAIFTRGRELGVSVVTLTQRPRWVPRYFFTEASKYLIYELPEEDDRKYLAAVSYGGKDSPLLGVPPGEYNGWFWDRKAKRTPPKLVRFPVAPQYQNEK